MLMKTKLLSFLIILLVVCLGLSQNARAVTPPPDGGYPNGNTAEGEDALLHLRSGGYNTAVGFTALKTSTSGTFNTAIGAGALLHSKTGGENTAVGAGTLQFTDGLLPGGNHNTAIGAFALFQNTSGNFNTAVGNRTLFNNNIGRGNIALGANAGSGVTTADNVICIGADGNNTSNSCFIGQIFGANSAGGTAVFINSNGKLGTAPSSRRFKEEIKPMEGASEVLFALKPVTFHYKKEIDPEGIPQFGLVAEDVEAINPHLVVRDKEGKINSVRYEQINAMLLNEFLKEHRKNEEQEATITQLKKELQVTAAHQQKQIEALTNGLQKVSAQLEASKSAPQVVNNR
jgi:Chaperone of endosialidase